MRGSWRDRQEAPAPEPFKTSRPIAKWLVPLFAFSIAVDAVAIISDISYLQLIDRAIGGAEIFIDEVETAESRQGIIGITQLVLFAATVVLFLIWFRRSYRNLGSLGADWLRFKPGWAVGAWFVPLLNAVRPKEIANDIWRVSDPQLPRTLNGPALGHPVSPLVNSWWGVFLISGALGRASFTGVDAETLDELATAARYFVAADIAALVAGVLAIMVVREVTERQDHRHHILAQAPSPPPPS